MSPTATLSRDASFSSTSSEPPQEDTTVPDPPIFTGDASSDFDFRDWSRMMFAKLDEMTRNYVDEKTKMEYVVSRTAREAFQKLLDRFEAMKGKGVAFGRAEPMVNYLAQYYDQDIRMIDLRFGGW